VYRLIESFISSPSNRYPTDSLVSTRLCIQGRMAAGVVVLGLTIVVTITNLLALQGGSANVQSAVPDARCSVSMASGSLALLLITTAYRLVMHAMFHAQSVSIRGVMRDLIDPANFALAFGIGSPAGWLLNLTCVRKDYRSVSAVHHRLMVPNTGVVGHTRGVRKPTHRYDNTEPATSAILAEDTLQPARVDVQPVASAAEVNLFTDEPHQPAIALRILACCACGLVYAQGLFTNSFIIQEAAVLHAMFVTLVLVVPCVSLLFSTTVRFPDLLSRAYDLDGLFARMLVQPNSLASAFFVAGLARVLLSLSPYNTGPFQFFESAIFTMISEARSQRGLNATWSIPEVVVTQTLQIASFAARVLLPTWVLARDLVSNRAEIVASSVVAQLLNHLQRASFVAVGAYWTGSYVCDVLPPRSALDLLRYVLDCCALLVYASAICGLLVVLLQRYLYRHSFTSSFSRERVSALTLPFVLLPSMLVTGTGACLTCVLLWRVCQMVLEPLLVERSQARASPRGRLSNRFLTELPRLRIVRYVGLWRADAAATLWLACSASFFYTGHDNQLATIQVLFDRQHGWRCPCHLLTDSKHVPCSCRLALRTSVWTRSVLEERR